MPYKIRYYNYKQYWLKIKNIYEKPVAKVSVSLILTLATISLFSLFALKPTFNAIAKLVKELKETRKIDQTLKKKIDSLNQAQAIFSTLTNDLPYVDKALPKQAEFNRFASEINFLSFKHNLVLASASFEEFELLSRAKEATPLKFKISLAGSFGDIKNFLNDLENLDRVVKIDDISFSTKTEITGAQVQADISAQAFWISTLNREEN